RAPDHRGVLAAARARGGPLRAEADPEPRGVLVDVGEGGAAEQDGSRSAAVGHAEGPVAPDDSRAARGGRGLQGRPKNQRRIGPVTHPPLAACPGAPLEDPVAYWFFGYRAFAT